MSELLKDLQEAGVFGTGDYVLSNGSAATLYCDFRQLLGHPALLNALSSRLIDLINLPDPNFLLVGVPIGAIPFVCAMSNIMQKPMVMVRKERKKYGKQNVIEGPLIFHRVVIVEDVITTGNSLLNIIKLLEAEGVEITKIIIILNREKGGTEKIREMGYKIQSLFTLREIENVLGIGRDPSA